MVDKAYLELELGANIPCLFNPADFRVAKSNRWLERPKKGRSAPDLVFDGGGSGTMSMELVFDTTDRGTAVTEHTNKLIGLMKVDRSLGSFNATRNTGRPKWVRFHWGDFHSFKAIVESLDITYTYFSSSGVPLRARANLTLRQFEEEAEWPRQNPTSGTPEPHRVHQVQRGESLPGLASRYFGDPTAWRDIAAVNGILDPLGLEPGSMLIIPNQEAP